jgi:diacylglycerol kinase family enzyme
LIDHNSYLNPIQVISLIDDGLERLKIFNKLKNVKILVAGGDGTVGSVINFIKKEIEEWHD